MIAEGSLLGIAIGLISIPVQLYRELIWTGMNFLVFDLLRLGPYLPITL